MKTLTEDINKVNKIIEDSFLKMKVARSYLQLMDNLIPLEEQKKKKLFSDTITPLHINTLCCSCMYSLSILYKHLLLSNDSEIPFFITQLCGIIYESFKSIDKYKGFLKDNVSESVFNEYKLKRKKIGIYQNKLESIRNKNAFHIDEEYRIFYDEMLNAFSIPILDIYNNTLEFFKYLHANNKSIMINKIDNYKSFIHKDIVAFIQKLENELTKFPNDKERKFLLGELKRIFSQK